MLYLARDGVNEIKYYVSHTAGFTITPVIVRGAGAGVATWDWGDGSATETGDSMSHAYAGAGTYTVTLTLINAQTYLRSIDVREDHVVGDFLGALRHCRVLTALTANTNAGLNTNAATVNLSGWWPVLSTTFDLHASGLSGSVAGWTTLPTLLRALSIADTLASGSISGITLNAMLHYFYVHSTAVSGAPSFASAVELRGIAVVDCALAQADVDAILLGLHNRRASFTYATPTASLGGTNAAPGGVYQYAAVPSTGREYEYALENDDDAEGFNLWAITTTA